MAANESELQAKLRISRERKELAAIENALGPVLTDSTPAMARHPSWAAEATARCWKIETEPDAVIAEDAESDEPGIGDHGVYERPRRLRLQGCRPQPT